MPVEKIENKNKNLKKMSLKERFNKILELPEEIVYNVPRITLVGKNIMVENYKNIIEYANNRIRINTSIGELRMDGVNFIIREITDDEILVNGSILKMEFIQK